jgi:hypothetical protein
VNAEETRLAEAREKQVPWRHWGPYLSERQWGTVREDYSADGNAWNYFSHDQARSRAYRWGEDGLAGISDDRQLLCFALAMWNGKDAIIKERVFGLTNAEGNHGEDAKEYYFYLDSTPTHSYMKYLYKYPVEAYPYDDIVRTNGKRNRHELEYELLDTGVFRHGYFDVLVEYAKHSPEDILIQISVTNRSDGQARLHLLPTLWFRNTWSWANPTPRPQLRRGAQTSKGSVGIDASHKELGDWRLQCAGAPNLLFTDNETNNNRCFNTPNSSPFVKDGINEYLVHNRAEAVNPAGVGTKAAAHYELEVGPGRTEVVKLRLAPITSAIMKDVLTAGEFDSILAARRAEADEFYKAITPPSVDADRASVMRQGLAGMLWSKQFYYYDVQRWLQDRHSSGTVRGRLHGPRNTEWVHMVNADILSMPDKWEYPWYAAWDLAFHCVPLAAVDPDFAKQQILLMLKEHYLHPSGQIPAYEWNFGDVNPPVHAWAAYYVYNIDKQRNAGKGDVTFLKSVLQKLLLKFTWWVNRKDRNGRNVFEGGFLGLDNIGVFDRSAPLPTGGYLEQADGTAWMAFFSQCMLEIAVELTHYDTVYGDYVLKFVEHFLSIASAMDHLGGRADEKMWDDEDGFYYDVLRLPNGQATRLKVRSMVGLLSLCATTVLTPENFKDMPEVIERVRWFLDRNPDLMATIANPRKPGAGDRRLLALMDEGKLRRVLAVMLDEREFLSPFGIRSLSRRHADTPFSFVQDGHEHRVEYAPAESTSGLFGGNSNWRGPVWMPVNVLLFRGLLKLYSYYGDEFKVECPTGSGKLMTLFEVAREIGDRLVGIFTQSADGNRPVYGDSETFQRDPNWRDLILFYEYFHGDNGAGIGASHQTGWTGCVASLIQMLGSMQASNILGGQVVAAPYRREEAGAKAPPAAAPAVVGTTA